MDRQELEKTASLAMLELDSEEAAALAEAVTSMLDYFSMMNEIDVEGVEPTSHAITGSEHTRADEPRESEGSRMSLLERSADHDDSYFIVPNVL